jgi:predicted GNAT superfamily acetyltransferase
MKVNTIIVKDKFGYFQGYFQPNGYFYLDMFIINRRYRGKGHAKTLARMLPKKTRLCAYPLYGMEKGKFKGLELSLLVRFYQSLGFKL